MTTLVAIKARSSLRHVTFCRAVWRLTAQNGSAPTHRELCAALGWASPNAVSQIRGEMAKKGLCDVPGEAAAVRARCIRLAGSTMTLTFHDTDEGRALEAAIAAGATYHYDSLTRKQRSRLRQIVRLFREFGRPPTVREICKACRLSLNGTQSFVLAILAEKGFLSYGGRSRSVRLTGASLVLGYSNDEAGRRLCRIIEEGRDV